MYQPHMPAISLVVTLLIGTFACACSEGSGDPKAAQTGDATLAADTVGDGANLDETSTSSLDGSSTNDASNHNDTASDTAQADTAQADTATPNAASSDIASPDTTQPDTTNGTTANDTTSSDTAANNPCDNIDDGTACDDDNACTEKTECKTGVCAGTKVVCDDGNSCTKDACDLAKGCSTVFAPIACDDGNACTAGDTCVGGACKPGKVSCDDNNTCTLDSCELKKCAYDFVNSGLACQDGSACTVKDACNAGKCVAGPAKVCDDNKSCTADGCDKKTGTCSHKATVGKACVGTACTVGGTCNAAGNCSGKLTNCDDGNDCSADVCIKNAGSGGVTCGHSAVSTGSLCGEVKRCDGVACVDAGNGWARLIASNGGHTCVVRGCGTANACQSKHGLGYCWGTGDVGQLGSGLVNAQSVPTKTSSGQYRRMTAGGGFTCAIDKVGDAWCWGANNIGQLGTNNSSKGNGKPTKVLRTGGFPLQNCVDISAGAGHACSVQTKGIVHCWGANTEGQLGAGGVWPKTVLGTIAQLPKAAAIAASNYATCIVATDGNVHCVGAGNYGQMGNGKTTAVTVKSVVVSGLKSPRLLRGGASHFCALTAARKVVCWGRGQVGQNGAGGKNSPIPVTVPGLPKIFGIATGGDTTCAFGQQGTTWCWGAGNTKQNGNAAASKLLKPTKLQGGTFYMLALGLGHGCGITPQGAVGCWGTNAAGQLGINKIGGFFWNVQKVSGTGP